MISAMADAINLKIVVMVCVKHTVEDHSPSSYCQKIPKARVNTPLWKSRMKHANS